MNKQPLDEYCKNILSVMLIVREEIRFNDLYRMLNKHGFEVSKPTLSEHLKHLTKKKIILRRKTGIQSISYKPNFEKFRNLGETSAGLNELLKLHLDAMEKYKVLPIKEQVEYVHSFMVLQELFLLKTEMLYTFEPEKRLDHFLNYLFTIQYFEVFKDWLLNNCQKNPEKYKGEATKAIDDLAIRYINAPNLKAILGE
jgi:arginine repressor